MHDRSRHREPTATLLEIVRSTPWLLDALRVVHDHGPAGAYIAAGAVRDAVWNALTQRASTGPHADVDVVYWDDREPEALSRVHQARLGAALPQLDWEVTNQATVHEWHWRHGVRVAPHRTVAEGLATWPETATAVAVRLAREGELEILAPLGLEDLFELRLRHNPVLASEDTFWQRVQSKRWRERWPELQLATGR